MSTAKKEVRTMDSAFAALLDADTHPDHINAAFRHNCPLPAGPTRVPIARYISREYHELEKARLWSRVWQVAAHEDDFPNIGDVVPYDIADKSYVVVRTGEDEYKAYYNACLHRGRKLRELRARGLTELRCPFHGWTWNLDGTIKQIPCAYDYNGLKRSEQSLPEVKVGRWGRFVFVNPDPQCEALEDFLGDLDGQFELLPYTRLYKAVHVGKVIKANWKVVQEAFMESYHVLMTHPQILTGGPNDLCTKYDAFGNYSRAIRCGALESAGMPSWEPLPHGAVPRLRHPLNGWIYEEAGDGIVQVTTPQGKVGRFDVHATWIDGERLDANPHLCLWVGGRQLPGGAAGMEQMNDAGFADKIKEKLGDNASPRAVGAEMQRQMLKAVVPSLADRIPDIELSASLYLTVFPNWHPWGSFNRINYRFRPNGDKHDEAIMECMYLAPIPESGKYTPASEIHWLDEEQDWVEAPELGVLARIFNQDFRNLPFVQAGLQASAKDHVQLADYNELKLRHFHELYGKWLDCE